MIKGFNRRIVIMKDTGSDIFDGAFFLVKENMAKQGNSAVNEAKKIIRQLEPDAKESKKRNTILTFLAGCAVGIVAAFFF